MKAAEATWRRLKIFCTLSGAVLRQIQNKATMVKKPPAKPKSGAMPTAETIFPNTGQIMTSLPEVAMPAPTNPATKPCVRLMGMPWRVAPTAQMTIAAVPAITMLIFMASELTMPLPMVMATAVPVAAPRKLKKAAMPIAARGERTRVPITVAIALAASLAPLAIPKPTARAIATTSRASPGMLQYYTLKDISDIFPAVGGIFQVLIDFAPFDYLTCIFGTSFKQFSQGGMK